MSIQRTHRAATLFASAVLAATPILAACGSSSSNPDVPGVDAAGAPIDGAAAQPDAEAPPSLAGAWQSECNVLAEGQSFRLDFDITDAAWALAFNVYGGEDCEFPFATVDIAGPYELERPSDAVAGAWDGRFDFAERRVTPHSEDAAAFLSSEQGCNLEGLEAGVATSVHEDGCPGLGQYPADLCASDYDIVKVDGDTLRFGNRPADNNMCTEDKRPSELSPVALTRQA
jgi:hypothetical protein